MMESVDSSSQPSSSKSQTKESSPSNDKGSEDTAPKKTTVRKRTKTGCLTCRKRRIKCDEGRPTCSNCIKSKRQCEGYNQRVIFKDPLGTFAPFGHIAYPPSSPQALVREQQLSVAQQKSTSQSLQIIAPKPPTLGYNPHAVPQFSPASPGQTGPGLQDASWFSAQPIPGPSTFPTFPTESMSIFKQDQWRQEPQFQSKVDFNQFTPDSRRHFQAVAPVEGPSPPFTQGDEAFIETQSFVRSSSDPDLWKYPSPEVEDDLLEESDNEHEVQAPLGQTPRVGKDGLGLIVSQRLNDRFNAFGSQPRTFAVHDTDHILATYLPSPADSPLNDQKVASVFWHFVNVTGPSISLYEKHPSEPSSYPQAEEYARRRHHIWTYTFPLLSFNHPALLQAILALGSLQIAKLQHEPPVASLKHYHLALRRIARNIGLLGKRKQPSNLAATLLLAYYEVWNSDHVKWSKHLLGARLIMKEIPFITMTKSMMAFRRHSRQNQKSILRQQPLKEPYEHVSFGASGTHHPQPLERSQDELDPLYCDWDQINVPLLQALSGRSVTYEQFGMSAAEDATPPRSREKFTEHDMNQYDQFSDLFWWYCKMDVYQSILGGTKLFMNYDLWTQCPPRAPMGRLEAIYGTYDHVMLLLGRVANFSSRDLVRKRRVARQQESELGHSAAPPGMFAGMMPTSSHIPTPRGFTPPRDTGEDTSPNSDSFEDAELEARTILAHREWAAIKAAFEDFKSHLGPEFDVLSPDLSPFVITPFGPTAHYRTYSIAGIWMNFYMGLIVLYRAHPDMPPWAMMAAGRSARETMRYAIEICRIAAGLEPNASLLSSLSTLVGAAFIESAFPMFVAGVQLQTQPQRDWLIRRLYDIARLTGWQSGRAIADGCESAWTKAAAAGKGAPYTRDPSIVADNPRSIWEQSRRLDDRIKEVTHAYGDEFKKVVLAREEMPHYALGLLGVQEDMERLDLSEQGEQVDA